MNPPSGISRKTIALVCFLIVSVLSACDQSAQPVDMNYSGTYNLDRGEGQCVMKVLQEQTDQLQIELLCNRGAPSYNSGYFLRDFKLKDSVAELVFEGYGEGCYLTFSFEEDGVVVEYVENRVNCGFGHAVYANGQYLVVDKETPILGCMKMTNPCGITPEP